MLGAINGNQVNLSEINSEGALTIILARTSIVQAGAVASSAAVSAIAAASARTQAAQNLASAVIAAIAAASAQSQPANSLTIQGAVLGGASLIAQNDTQGIGSASAADVAALLAPIAAGDTLESTAEAESIKAVLNFIQQAQTLAAAGTVEIGALADILAPDDVSLADGVAAIVGDGPLQELDDTLLAIYFPVLVRKLAGSDLSAHGAGSSLTPHSRGNPVTVH